MRLLLVSDLHYTLKQYDWVDSVADRFDVVVIAGDHIDIAGFADSKAQIVVLTRVLRAIGAKTRLVVSSGNHDLNGFNDAGEKVARWLQRACGDTIVGDGGSLSFAGQRITVCPWWDGPHTRDLVGAQLERDARDRPPGWIWVYHAPPDASPVSWTGSKHYGDTQLVEWITRFRPAIVLCGHVHQSPFRAGGSWADRIGDTWVFNAGRQIGPVPAHVIVDTDARRAMWFSLAGNEVVALDEPLQRPLAELTEF